MPYPSVSVSVQLCADIITDKLPQLLEDAKEQLEAERGGGGGHRLVHGKELRELWKEKISALASLCVAFHSHLRVVTFAKLKLASLRSSSLLSSRTWSSLHALACVLRSAD